MVWHGENDTINLWEENTGTDLSRLSLKDLGLGGLYNISEFSETNLSMDSYPAHPKALLKRITVLLDFYLVPMIVAVGVIGNMISFCVFVFSHLKSLSSSVYLAALAISDTGFLICVFMSWLNNVNVRLYHQPGWCQTFVYFTYVFSFLSVWYVVGFTVERYIAVCFPFKRGDMCTIKRAKIVVIILAILAVLLYNFGIWTSGVHEMGRNMPHYCIPNHIHRELVTFLNNADTVITLVIPSLLIIALNLRIVYAVAHTREQRKRVIVWQGREEDNRNHLSTIMADSSRNRAQAKVTKMLLVVSTIFLVLNLPHHTFKVYSFFLNIVDSSYTPSITYIRWQTLFQYVYYINFCINFILYNICGKNFRVALKRLFFHYRPCRSNNFEPNFGNSSRRSARSASTRVTEVRLSFL